MAALSDYEKERLKNMEENRRILESIRQEQLYSFEGYQAPKKTAKKDSSTQPKAKRKKEVKPITENDDNCGSDKENVPAPTLIGQRKSARLQGKKPKYSWKEDTDDNGSDDEYEAEEDDDDDDDDEEYSDDEDEDEDGGSGGRKRRRGSSRPVGPRKKVVVPKDRPNHYGAVPGIPVGKFWETRLECCADGIHRPTVAGIHAGPQGAYSIALSGGYEDDLDLGDCFTYTGEGGRELKGTKAKPKNLRTAPQSKNQTLTRGNLALSLNVSSKMPVRVIRGYKLPTKFAPKHGYRYDGLYSVEKFWDCVGLAGFKVYKFALRRLPDQAPPPWIKAPPSEKTITNEDNKEGEKKGKEDEEAEGEDEEAAARKPMLVKLFNKNE